MFKQFRVYIRCALALFLFIPTPVWADHVPTQEPYGYNESVNTTSGDLTISILSSDGFEDSPPEKYTIFFAMSTGVSTSSFCVSTSFGHVTNTWQDYVFSISNLRSYFELPVGTFYYKVRSDNDSDNSFSTLSSERSVTLPNQTPFSDTQTDWTAPTNTCNDTATTTTTTTSSTTTTIPPAVPDDATNVSVNYQGKDVYFSWDYTDGNTLAKEFHINYSYDNQTWERVIITDTTSRTYTLDYTNIQTGTFYWTFGVCGDLENGESCTDSDSNNFETTEYVAPTTTTLPPPPPPPPPTTTTTTLYIVVNDDGTESEYTESEVKDGTVERDKERTENEKLYGCYMTNAQIDRGDCDIPEEKEEETIIIIEDEQEYDTEKEFSNDDDLVSEVDVKDENKESKSTEEEDLPTEEIEIDIEKIEEEFDFEEEEIIIPEEIEIIIIDEKEEEEEFIDEENTKDDTREDRSTEVDVVSEDREDELGRDKAGIDELSEEELKVEIQELEEVIEEIIEIDIPEITEEELEELSEEELVEYKEAKEEAIEQYVKELETKEVIEVLEQVNDVGLDNIAEVSQDVIEVVAQVVEEVVQIAQEEELTEEQIEVVAEVLGFEETEDVKTIAEAVKTDTNVAQAVDEFVERAVENKGVENYTLADATTEIAFESFVADPLSVIIDVDLNEITLNNITSDMTQDQKEKAQEVIVPTILVKIASFAFRRFN